MDYRRNQHKIIAIEETESMDQFNLLVDLLEKQDYCHYEISNFARNEKYSRHNMSYWTGEKYLGFGPSAHSYDGNLRRWNLARNASYMKALQSREQYFETEVLDPKTQYHDYILTNLRTQNGVDTESIKERWGIDFLEHFIKCSKKFLENGKLSKTGNTIILTREGMFISDHIISELFMQT